MAIVPLSAKLVIAAMAKAFMFGLGGASNLSTMGIPPA